MWILPRALESASFQVPQDSTSASNWQASEAASSLTLRGKPMPVKSWLRAWTKTTWLQRLFGRMLPPSMGDRFVASWTSSLVGSRAKTSQTRASGLASEGSAAGSGSTTSESSRKFSLDSSSLKTSRLSGHEDSMSFSLTLPRSGSMRSGALSEQPMLVPHITVTGCSSWPTATVGDSHGSGSHGYGKVSRSTGKSRSEGMTLTDRAVRLWPTTTAHDAKDTGAPTEYQRKSPGVQAIGHLLQMRLSGAKSLPKDRTLNPRFAEWLMGWPIGWTDCDSQVTEWFLLKPLTLSDSCGDGCGD